MRIEWLPGIHLKKLEYPSPKDALIVPNLVEIGQTVLEKEFFFNDINVFLLFRNNLPLEKGELFI